jgi:biotin-dependent carboxylase-like uncharacterized protein
MSLRVLHPGTFSLLVDGGRPGTRSLGVPLGGAADRMAWEFGNALVGNRPDSVALEIALSGPTLIADSDVSGCILGAPFDCHIDGIAIPAAHVFHLRTGQTLKIGGTNRGARACFCVRGGFESKFILGSGTSFAPIAESDVLVCESATDAGRSLAHSDVASLFDESTSADVLRVIDSPQADWLPANSLFKQSFTVSPASNRMGVRLQGEPLARQPREMISEAVAPGAVQITNEGLPIILGVDGQTIGGYPKIAHVIRADLDRVGQLRPGQAVRFERISLEQAEVLAEERRRKRRSWLAALRLASL